MKLSHLALLASLPLGIGAETFCGRGVDMIRCQNGSTCQEDQVADFSSYELPDGSYHEVHTPQHSHHCVCPLGWTGEVCDVPIANCEDGTHYCLNGGYCVPDGAYCDCSGAVDEQGYRYVGKWCEHKEAREHSCEDDFSFCLHGGRCNEEFPAESDEPCFCVDGYEGPHCEYKQEYELPPLNLCEDFECENGGVCKLGSGKGLEDDYLEVVVGTGRDVNAEVYCECPYGFHGEQCEVSSEKCGDDKCYNGGECLPDFDDESGAINFRCDCTSAGDGYMKFAGQYCQYKAEADNFCTDSNSLHGHLFCVNGGVCREDEPYLGCECPDGFEGFSCEFPVSPQRPDQDYIPEDYYNAEEDYYTPSEQTEEEDYVEVEEDDYAEPEQTEEDDYYVEVEEDDYVESEGEDDKPSTYACNLDCNGNGVCKKGVKDVESLGKAAHGGNLGDSYSDDFEHCVCIPGYVGLQCEHSVEVCGVNDFNNPEHFCLHGGECKGNSRDGYSCDCTLARADEVGIFYTGDHCQQPSVSCHLKEELAKEIDLPPSSFCANGGVCGSKIDEFGEHPGCLCPEGWIGDFCEVWEEKQAEYQTVKEGISSHRRTKIIAYVFLVLAAVLVAAVLCGFGLAQSRGSRPSPGFRRFGFRREYSKKHGFRSSFIANDHAIGALRRSWNRKNVPVDDDDDDQGENLAPYSDTHQSSDEEEDAYVDAIKAEAKARGYDSKESSTDNSNPGSEGGPNGSEDEGPKHGPDLDSVGIV